MAKHFDIETYLDDRDIPYLTVGKNIGVGWIGMSCPFCGDESTHFGINPEATGFFCWACGEKGNIYKLIKQLESKTSGVNSIYSKYSIKANRYSRQSLRHQALSLEGDDLLVRKTALMKIYNNFSRTPFSNHINYLQERDFNYNYLTYKYKLRYSGPASLKDSHCIIIPILYQKELLSYVARDVTNTREQRYRNCENDVSIVSPKQSIYNLDNAKSDKPILVVEGPTDVWRIGDNTVATMGTQYCAAQVHTLSSFNKIYILFDNTVKAQTQATDLAKQLSVFSNEVYVLQTDMKSDPALLTTKDVKQLRYELGL